MELIKAKGKFFLPENKSIKIPGILTFSHQEGAILELLGTFTTIPGYHQIILGLTSEGKPVSLYRNEAIEYNLGSGFTVATFKSRYLFIGINFDYQRDLRFRTLNCRFNVLNEWLYTDNMITHKHDRDQSSTLIKFKSPYTKTINLSKDLDLILGQSYNERGERFPIKITIQETSLFKILYKKRVPLDQILATLKKFQNLLTFVSQKQVYPQDINIDFRIKNDSKIHSASLYFQIPNYQESIKKYPKNYEFLFSHSLIPQKIDVLIHKWFALGDSFKLIITELCSQFYNPKMYQEDKFLSIVTSLEAFHREFRDKNLKVTNLNRYESLFEEGRTAFNWLLKIPSKGRFCRDLRDYRNDLIHNNPERVLKTKNIHKLYRLTEYAKIIVVTAILRELGLTNIEIKSLYQKNMIFRKI